MSNGQPFLEWDTYKVVQQQADCLLESREVDNGDKAFARASADRDLFEYEWEW